jgi:nicotinamidase-related amidase
MENGKDKGDDTRDPAESGGTALLIVDMLNDLRFAEAERLKPALPAVCDAILTLRDAADRRGLPVLYVNDNYGDWRSDRAQLIAEIRSRSPVPELIDGLWPRDGDYFIAKPHFSGFYATGLQAVLPRIGVSRLILTGIVTDICLLFTAADAHMRNYGLWVPCDTTASIDIERRDRALNIMAEAMAADTRSSVALI